MSGNVVQIDNRSGSDCWIVNTTTQTITVACDGGQGGKFSVNLEPGVRQRVTWGIKAQPYPFGKQRYDEFQFELGRSETWGVYEEAGQLVMKEESATDLAE